MLKPVPSVEADPKRCRAVILTSTAIPSPQCSRRPCGEMRQGWDGQLYPVCRQHKRAKHFLPWTARTLMSQLDAFCAYARVIKRERAAARNLLRRDD